MCPPHEDKNQICLRVVPGRSKGYSEFGGIILDFRGILLIFGGIIPHFRGIMAKSRGIIITTHLLY